MGNLVRHFVVSVESLRVQFVPICASTCWGVRSARRPGPASQQHAKTYDCPTCSCPCNCHYFLVCWIVELLVVVTVDTEGVLMPATDLGSGIRNHWCSDDNNKPITKHHCCCYHGHHNSWGPLAEHARFGEDRNTLGQEVGILFWWAPGAHELRYSHVHICMYYVNLQHMILFYLCILYTNVLFPWYCKVCVPCVFVILQFALRQKTEVCSIRRSLKTCFCQLQETSAPPTTTSIPQTHDRRRRGAHSQDAPKTNTLPAAQKETYEDCTSEKRKKRLLWNTFNDPW